MPLKPAYAFLLLPAVAMLAASCSSLPTRNEAYKELCSKGIKNAPVISSVSPADGRRTGGTLVTITGRNFAPGASIMVGKGRCAGVSQVDSSTLTCRTSRHAPGKVEILVANPDRGCGILKDAFTFAPAVTISPDMLSIAVSNEATFRASRGVPPYAFSIASGGGTIDQHSGHFIAPTEPGVTIIRVNDSSGTSGEALVNVGSPVALVPPRHLMTGGTYQFAAIGGVPPYSFSLFSGEGAIDPSGVFRAAEEPGNITVFVEDNLGNQSSAILEVSPGFEFDPNTPQIMVGSRVSVKGGSQPVTLSILAGLGSVDPATGDYFAPDVPGKVVLRALDSAGNYRDAQYSVERGVSIHPEAKTIAVGDTVTFFPIGGIAPFEFSLANGNGQINSRGVYIAPESAGTETVRVTDSRGNTAEAAVTITSEGLNLRTLVTGHSHRCALVNGGVQCWGGNSRAQLGPSSNKPREHLPVTVEGSSSGVLSLAAGLNHTCALLNGGGVTCWGDNSYGQLGNGSTKTSPKPVKVVGLANGVQAIAAGAYHTCAITDGSLMCWGDNRRGQLGNGTTLMSSVPVQVKWLTQGVQSVGAGTFHTCAVIRGAVQCWGYNFSGQLGDGTVADRLTPAPVRGLEAGAREVILGDFHSCALLDQDVRCWGYNGSGQLGGNPVGRNGLIPVQVPLPQPAVSLALGSYHSCALLPDKSVHCWGYNHEGQVFPNSSTKVFTPHPVPFAQGADSISAAANHSCALIGNKVHCWGFNGHARFSPDPILLR